MTPPPPRIWLPTPRIFQVLFWDEHGMQDLLHIMMCSSDENNNLTSLSVNILLTFSKRHATTYIAIWIMTKNIRFVSIITWTVPKVTRKKKSERHTFYINNRRHNKRVLSQTFAVLSFEFSNARAIVAIWKVFTCSVVFAGIVRAVIHLWKREENTIGNKSEW